MPLSTEGTESMTRRERNYQTVGESGTDCEGSKTLAILNEIKELYEDRIRRIDEEAGGDGKEIKLRALQSWVSDLGEQNVMLVQTVEQLEREAVGRVALLQEGLQRSSQAALAYMTKLDDYDKDISPEKLVLPARNEELLHIRIQNLQSDIANLLELIWRAREEDRWDTIGLAFNEVTFEDIFGAQSLIPGHTSRSVPDSQVPRTVKVCVEINQSPHPNEVPDPNPASYQWMFETPSNEGSFKR